MILFIDNKDYIPYIQSVHQNRDICVYNLSSMYSGFRDIYPLMDTIGINPIEIPINQYVQMPEFDSQFLYLTLNNTIKFSSLMNIMLPNYNGYIVLILVYRESYRDAIMESLIKLIQQRYEYPSYIIQDIDDIYDLKEPSYGTEGLIRLEQDINRYHELYYNGNVETPYPLDNISTND